MSDLLIVCPSLNRPAALKESLRSLLDTSAEPFAWMVPTQPVGVCTATNEAVSVLHHYAIVGIFADDVRMKTPGWDRIVREAMKDMGGNGLVYGPDGIQNEALPTHPFLSTSIPLALGWIYPPGLHHFFGDNYLYRVASGAGMVRYLPELAIEHLHPTVGKSAMDSTYEAASPWWSHDATAWNECVATGRLQTDIELVKRLKP